MTVFSALVCGRRFSPAGVRRGGIKEHFVAYGMRVMNFVSSFYKYCLQRGRFGGFASSEVKHEREDKGRAGTELLSRRSM